MCTRLVITIIIIPCVPTSANVVTAVKTHMSSASASTARRPPSPRAATKG